MPFRQATGRETCNDCRSRIDLGAPVYVGDVTGMRWCESCAAANLGRTVEGPVPAVLGLRGMDSIREGIEALARKYQWETPRSWHERGEE
jgi:hypothetical protein